MYHKCYIQTIIKATVQLLEKIESCLGTSMRPFWNELKKRITA